MVVIHRAMRQDLSRLAARLDGLAGQGGPGPGAPALRRYTAALLAQIRARHRAEEDYLWPLLAATAGPAVDLAPLTDDHQAIDAAASRALACATAGPGALAGLPASVRALGGMLGEHLADTEQQVFPALRRYLPAGAYQWCEQQILHNAPASSRRFAVPWLARYAQPGELPRLPACSGWRGRIRLAAARPGYAHLERRAFGPDSESHPHEEEK
jgi:Hemerythrin HHE cation binding domain